MQKRKILSGALVFGIFVTSFLAWFFENKAILVPGSSVWVLPMLWFSLYAVLLSLAVMVFSEILLLELVLTSSLFFSLIFAPHLWQLAGIALGSYFLFFAAHTIRRDMELNIKISPWKSLQAGKSYLLMALSVVICMQYFVTVKKMDGQVNMPKLDLNEFVARTALPVASYFDPALRKISQEDLTVDQYLTQQIQKSIEGSSKEGIDENLLNEQLPVNLPQAEKEKIKRQAMENYTKSQQEINQKNVELALREGRKQFSDMLGREVGGDEKVSQIFTTVAIARANDFFHSTTWTENVVPYLPLLFALVLFSIVYPLGSMLSIAWFLVVKLLVYVLRRGKVLSVREVSVQKEILE